LIFSARNGENHEPQICAEGNSLNLRSAWYTEVMLPVDCNSTNWSQVVVSWQSGQDLRI